MRICNLCDRVLSTKIVHDEELRKGGRSDIYVQVMRIYVKALREELDAPVTGG